MKAEAMLNTVVAEVVLAVILIVAVEQIVLLQAMVVLVSALVAVEVAGVVALCAHLTQQVMVGLVEHGEAISFN